MIKKLMKNIFAPLLQRIQALEYSLGLIADYVVEQGTSGIWTYEKWQSGKAVCWGNQTNTLADSGVAWGNLYAYASLTVPNYPFTFSEVPTEVASISNAYNACWLYHQNDSSNTASKTCPYALIKVNSFTQSTNATVSYHVIGKWK